MSGRPTGAMILAAGFGTRMGALTADRPKPLIEVAGRPLIAHALDAARGAGLTRIAVNGHYRAAQMANYLKNERGVTFLEERPRILESGGGLRNALPHLGAGPVCTLNADAVWTGPNPVAQLTAAWDPARMDALLLLVPQARAVARLAGGDFAADGQGRLSRDKGGAVYTGAQILAPGALEGFPEGPFSLNAVWDRIARAGRLFGVVHRGRWADVGHPAGIALADEMVRQDETV